VETAIRVVTNRGYGFAGNTFAALDVLFLTHAFQSSRRTQSLVQERFAFELAEPARFRAIRFRGKLNERLRTGTDERRADVTCIASSRRLEHPVALQRHKFAPE